MTLIKGWRTFWRWWSTWLVLVGSTIITFAPQLSVDRLSDKVI